MPTWCLYSTASPTKKVSEKVESVNDFTDKDKSDIEYLINEAIEDIPQYTMDNKSIDWRERLFELLEKVRKM